MSSEYEKQEFYRSSIVWSFFCEQLISGELEDDFDDILVDVLVKAFVNIKNIIIEEHKEDRSHMLASLPQFEKAFPGLTQLVNGEQL